MPTQDLQATLSRFDSYSKVLRSLGLCISGSAFKGLKERVRADGLDVSHFLTPQERVRAAQRSITRPLSSILVKGNSSTSTSKLKKRLFAEGYLKNVCSSCQQEPTWNGSPLTLQLDHVNGDRTDNRIENLRILCPNCHTQTSTYAGKRLAKPKARKLRVTKTKIRWPSNAEMQVMVWKTPTVRLRFELGVSDVAIAKHCRKNGIKKPPRGYWSARRDSNPRKS